MTRRYRSVSRRTFLQYAAVSSGATLLAACQPGQGPQAIATQAPAAPTPAPAATSASSGPNYPINNTPRGSITYAAAGLSIASIDPHNIFPPGDFATRLSYDPLLAPDDKGAIAPVLAISFRAVDPTTWEYKLRPNVRFGTGNPVTAEAVKFNFDRVADPNNKLQVTSRLPTFESASVVDAQTIRFKTKSPDPIFPRRTFAVLIADPAEVQKPGYTANPSPTAGTGLFRLANFDSGRTVVLEAVQSSWRGTPRLQKITIQSLPELGTVIAGLRTGDIDMSLIAADRVEDLVRAGLRVSRVPQLNIYQLWLASAKGGPLADKRVRQALAIAIDREAIVKELYAGAAQVASQWVGPDGFGFNPNLRPYPYDPKRAKELLAEAGFGSGLTLKTDYLQSLVFNGFQQACQGYFDEIGVKLDITVNEVNVFVSKILQGPRAPVLANGVQYGPAYDADFALTWFSGKQPTDDLLMYRNDAFQAAFDSSRTEVDEKKRLELLQRIMQIMHEDYAGIPILQPLDNYVHTAKMENYKPHGVGQGYVDWQNVSKAA